MILLLSATWLACAPDEPAEDPGLTVTLSEPTVIVPSVVVIVTVPSFVMVRVIPPTSSTVMPSASLYEKAAVPARSAASVLSSFSCKSATFAPFAVTARFAALRIPALWLMPAAPLVRN